MRDGGFPLCGVRICRNVFDVLGVGFEYLCVRSVRVKSAVKSIWKNGLGFVICNLHIDVRCTFECIYCVLDSVVFEYR